MTSSSLPPLPSLDTSSLVGMSTMALLAVTVTESPGGKEGTALAVEMNALTFFTLEVKSSVKE